MIYIDSIEDSPDFTVNQRIGGRVFAIRCWWNELSGSWHVYFGLPNQPFDVKGRALVGSNIIKSQKYRDHMPDGMLTVIDKEKVFGRPGRDDFGIDKRFSLVYISRDEVE